MIDNFQELSELVDSGIALIPVISSSKSPYAELKGKPALSMPDLMRAINWYDQTSEECKCVAIRCGSLSGGLICIDVDSKHKQGFSERIFGDIKNLYPEIFDKLEIDRTPSGGLHFYYRVKGEAPKSSNLASRKCTTEEMLVRPDLKTRCFLELKSEGGLSQCYPSFGYTKVKRGSCGIFGGVGICLLSDEEHGNLMSLCYLYEEVVKEIPVRKSANRDSKYEEGKTPFDQFNLSDLGGKVLEDLGWRYYKTSGRFDKWIKPGDKSNNCGASFNNEKRTYAIYSTKSNLDVECYNPSSLLCKEQFGGDWDKLRLHLTSLGFGVMKPYVEKIEVKKAIKNGVESLPANFSDAAKEEFRIGIETKGKENPHGEFWTSRIGLDGEEKFTISRELVLGVCRELGFRVWKEKPVRIDGNLIKICQERDLFDLLKGYIGTGSRELLDIYEDFLQKSGTWTIKRLDILDESEILQSSKYLSYKFYRNCYVSVDSEKIEIFDYSELSQLIWEHDKKDRDFKLVSAEEARKGLYSEFIGNAIGWSQYLMKCIGFYAHDYRDEEGYMVITTEKSDNEKDGGRCGKNIFWKLFSCITTFKSTAASMIKKDNQLLQSWNGERIFCLSDIPKNFELIFFKDMITDGAVVRKLYANEFVVSVHDMAKLGGSSNYTFDDSDPGVKGRLRLVEFTSYYKELGGVKAATGKMFPKDWNEDDFLYFDNIMMYCIQEYLAADCIIKEIEQSSSGWNRKFEGMYYHLYSFIKDNINDWISIGKVSNAAFNKSYLEFRVESNIHKAITSFTINKALVDYCEHFKIPFVCTYRKKNGELSDGMTWTENSVSIRGRLFGNEATKFLSRNPEALEVKEEIENLPF